jgi:hypothetical protein
MSFLTQRFSVDRDDLSEGILAGYRIYGSSSSGVEESAEKGSEPSERTFSAPSGYLLDAGLYPCKGHLSTRRDYSSHTKTG